MTKAEHTSVQHDGGSTRLDLLDLELFVEAAGAGSITHGARRVHVSLPSASARIRAMERALGVELFDRRRRGVTPTAAGYLLLRHARTVLNQVGRLRDDMHDLVGALITTVRLVVNASAYSTFLAPRLLGFLAQHPDVDLDIGEMSSRKAVREVLEGRAEVGVVAESALLAGLSYTVLHDLQMVLVVAPDSPLRDRAQVTLAECIGEPFIGLTSGRTLAQHHESANGSAMPTPRYRIKVPSTALVCDAVAAGLGVSILPAAALADRADPAAGGPVVAIPLGDPWACQRTVLCHRTHAPLSPSADLLMRYLRDGPPPGVGSGPDRGQPQRSEFSSARG